MADKTIVCKDCGKEFVFTEGEQEFYKEKGFENDPVRCPDYGILIPYKSENALTALIDDLDIRILTSYIKLLTRKPDSLINAFCFFYD